MLSPWLLFWTSLFYKRLTGILEIRTVSEGGILAIKGVKSQYYICMSKAGQLKGKVTFLLLSVGMLLINMCTKCVKCPLSCNPDFSLSQRIYNENCNFKEVFLENYFNAYSSAKWTKNGKEMFITLSQKGRPLRGKKTRREHVASHFIPMKCRDEDRQVDWRSRGLLSERNLTNILTDTYKLITNTKILLLCYVTKGFVS